MTALQVDALLTVALCLGEVGALAGAAVLLGIPQRAIRDGRVMAGELRRAYWIARLRRRVLRLRRLRLATLPARRAA